jgi:hypothetical protein
MKTVMTMFASVLLCVIGMLLSGCYTEMATQEYSEERSYSDSDTAYEDEQVTINNHYYLDDDYRRSRFRVSFNYYYPTYHSSWIAGYYNSYYNDYYWGMNRPWGWYHYPGYVIIYPTPWWPPYYDPWYPYVYYPAVAYYPGYYPSPTYPNSPPQNPGRIRDNGPTRDDTNPDDRTRPVTGVGATGGTEVATGTPGVRIRDQRQPEAVTVKERPRNETPWWERQQQEKRQTESSDRTSDRPVVRQKEQRRTETDQSQPKSGGTRPQARPAEKKNTDAPESVAPPKRQGSGNSGAKPAERPREERRSYSPPPSQQAPASSAPRTGGGSSGSSGQSEGSRKRAE